jgi:hypothetical protein
MKFCSTKNGNCKDSPELGVQFPTWGRRGLAGVAGVIVWVDTNVISILDNIFEDFSRIFAFEYAFSYKCFGVWPTVKPYWECFVFGCDLVNILDWRTRGSESDRTGTCSGKKVSKSPKIFPIFMVLNFACDLQTSLLLCVCVCVCVCVCFRDVWGKLWFTDWWIG